MNIQVMREIRDLTVGPPRRWSETIDGIPWLPRLIDKARAAYNGTLGAYLFGQSPMDHACLRVLGLGHRSFAQIVASASNDDAVIAAIAQRDPSALDRARAWGAGLGRRHRLFFAILDADDGYAQHLRTVRPALNVAANTLTWAIKRIWRRDPTRGNPRPGANQNAP